MTATKIIAWEQVGDRVVEYVAVGETFEQALVNLYVIRDPRRRPEPSAASATMYRGLGGLTEP